MKTLGLTGGIASGKSTVQGMLRALGADVIDADAVYHELLAPVAGEASALARAVAARFPGVLTTDGRIDREALGQRVFADASERRALESVTHPAVAALVRRRLLAACAHGALCAFYDVPLLYERGLDQGLDGVLVVWVPQAVQAARLAARNKLDADAVRQRLAAQLPIDEKRQRATWVIDNSGTLGATQRQVERFWQELVAALARGELPPRRAPERG